MSALAGVAGSCFGHASGACALCRRWLALLGRALAMPLAHALCVGVGWRCWLALLAGCLRYWMWAVLILLLYSLPVTYTPHAVRYTDGVCDALHFYHLN